MMGLCELGRLNLQPPANPDVSLFRGRSTKISGTFLRREIVPRETFLKIPLVPESSFATFRVPPRKWGCKKR
jgi:hypothetical protein